MELSYYFILAQAVAVWERLLYLIFAAWVVVVLVYPLLSSHSSFLYNFRRFLSVSLVVFGVNGFFLGLTEFVYIPPVLFLSTVLFFNSVFATLLPFWLHFTSALASGEGDDPESESVPRPGRCPVVDLDDLPAGDWGGVPSASTERLIAIEQLIFSGKDELFDPKACVLLVFDVVLLDLNPPILSGGAVATPRVLSTSESGFCSYGQASNYADGLNRVRMGCDTFHVVVPRLATAAEIVRYIRRSGGVAPLDPDLPF